MNLGALFQSIGDAGNQFATAKLGAGQMRLKQLMDKLKQDTEATSLDDMKERLRRLKMQPDTDEAKFNQTLDTFRKVFKREPTEQEKGILFGLPAQGGAQKITNEFEGWREAFKDRVGRYPTDQEIEQHTQDKKGDKEVKVKAVGDVPYQITDKEGKTWNVDDPALPDDLKKELKAYRKAGKESAEEKATVEARKNAEAINRALAIGDARELQKQRGEVIKTARRGISGHSFLKTVAQEVATAEITGGKGTTSGDLLITEGFMQLMFGIDPKGIRGSTKTMEYLLKQGGWDDKAIAEMNSALTGGKLSQQVRQQILEAATRQVTSWDQAVTMTGSLTDDPKTKAVIDRYLKSISQGNDLSDLGGKQN